MGGRLARLLAPRHIALYGGDAAAEAVRRCRDLGYDGQLWPVNPRRETLAGLPCHPGTEALPEPPDAAFLAVPAEASVGIVRQLAARGAGGAVCHAAGFAEEGPSGADREARLRAAADGMPVIGPNCIGVLNYLDGTALWADQHGGTRTERGVAVVTQSGNIGQNITMQRRSLPLACVVTAGNGAVTGVPEIVEALLDDPRVTAIGLHLEGIADAAGFARAARAALRRGVPVVVLKTGTSELGARANLSHTSSLAGSDVLCDALFRDTGAARVHDVATFVETLKLLHVHGPLEPAGGRRARIVSASCSGGEAALVADTAERHGVDLPPLPEETARRLRGVLGERVHLHNPLDYQTAIWGDFAAQRACFEALLSAPGHDMHLLLLDLPRTDRCADDAWTTTLRAFAAAGESTGAPACVVSSLPEGVPEDAAGLLLAAGIAPMQGIADCLRAVAAAHATGRARARLDGTPAPGPSPRATGPGPAAGTLDEAAGKRELAAAGVPVPEGRVVGPGTERENGEAAARAARELGFPVVVKALSAGLAHKSDAGGVRLGLDDEGAVREAVAAMSGLAGRFLVERMVPGAVAELLVGAHRDPVFGTALTLGAGGVLVELVRDTATLLLPTGREQIAEALESLRLWPVLRGFRGRPPGDVDAVVDTVRAVAGYLDTHPEVAELDVNPLLVLPEGQGAVAADVLLRVHPAPPPRQGGTTP
ncbi:acetate--CoA ligase family protein [Streptomyces sp. HNM0574]|uniref:acetate--CoA ligase family protein n=1 Tax=Streptomyces sp. HNM0574 TaxID=2714954 RepID=UPI00146CE033|nr:acetate--CoA ligase family protein [Streptomyces sp. HNM0574]NLU66150.1 acetate--CoA ligase family protein [Streptomyces sp. HNM0574]